MIVNVRDLPEVDRAFKVRPGARYVVMTRATLNPKAAAQLGDNLRAAGLDVIVLHGFDGHVYEVVAPPVTGPAVTDRYAHIYAGLYVGACAIAFVLLCLAFFRAVAG